MLARSSEVIGRPEDEHQYLTLHSESNLALVMNDTSHRIWDLCDGTCDADPTVAKLLGFSGETSQSVESRGQIEIAVRQHLTVLQYVGLIVGAKVTSQPVNEYTNREFTESSGECHG